MKLLANNDRVEKGAGKRGDESDGNKMQKKQQQQQKGRSISD